MLKYLFLGTIAALIGRIVDSKWKFRHSVFVILLWPFFIAWTIYEIVKPGPDDPA